MSNFNVSKSKFVIFPVIISLIAFSIFLHKVTSAAPWSDPDATGASASYGAIDGYSDGSNQYLSIGGPANSSPYSQLEVYSGSGVNYPLFIEDQSSNRLLVVASSGVVVIGTTTFSSDPIYQLQVNSIIADQFSTNFTEYPSYPRYPGLDSKVHMNTTTISSTLTSDPDGYGSYLGVIKGFGSVSADTIRFTDSGTPQIQASDLDEGLFDGTQGNFAFRNSLAISTSSTSNLPATLSVYDDFPYLGDPPTPSGYFSASTSIKLLPPISNAGKLSIGTDSGSAWLSGWNKGIRLDNLGSGNHPAIELGGGTSAGSGIYGIGAKSNRLHFFKESTEWDYVNNYPNFYNLTITTTSIGIGIDQNNPSSTLHVSGTLRISGAGGFQLGTSATTGYVLTASANGTASWAQAASGITNPGSNYTVRHNGSGWIGSSLLVNDGSFIGVGVSTSSPGTLLRVGSSGYLQVDKSSLSTPASEDCNTVSESGRLAFSTASSDNYFYVCMGLNGWKKSGYWYDPNWSYRKKITISKDYVVGSHSNFPVFVKIYDPYLITNAQASGNDIVFTDIDGVTKLDYEIENYTNGSLIAWVKIPSLSSSANKEIYMYYGNPSAISQQSATSTWDSNFRGVWHLKDDVVDEGNVVGAHKDSTVYAQHANQSDNVEVSTNWHLGQSFDGGDYIRAPAYTDGSDATLSAWVRVNSISSTGLKGVLARSTNNHSYNIIFDDTNNKFAFYARKGSSWSTVSSTANTVVASQWYYVTLTHTANTLRGYINGQLIGSDTNATAVTVLNDYLHFAHWGGGSALNSHIDEVRRSNIARSIEWIQTEYNNQNSPSTFLSVGAEE